MIWREKHFVNLIQIKCPVMQNDIFSLLRKKCHFWK